MIAVAMAGVLWTAGSAMAAGPGGAVAPAGGHAAPSGGSGGGGGEKNGGGGRSSPSNQPATNQPAASNQRENRNDRGNSEGNSGLWYGNPWSPYSSGWGYGGYPDSDGTFAEPTYTDNSGSNDSGTTPAAPANPQQSPGTPSPASVAALRTNAIDKSPEMIAAENAVRSAQTAYATERGRALAVLGTKPEFQEALARKHNAAKTLQEAKTTGQGQPAVIEAATVKMDAADEVSKMREEAVAADPGASAAKSSLMQAVADRDALRAKLLAQH